MKTPPSPPTRKCSSKKIAPSTTKYRGRTPPPTVVARPATPAEARRLAEALDALVRGWAIAEARRRLTPATPDATGSHAHTQTPTTPTGGEK